MTQNRYVGVALWASSDADRAAADERESTSVPSVPGNRADRRGGRRRPGAQPVGANIDPRQRRRQPSLYRAVSVTIVGQDVVGREQPRAKAGARTPSDLGVDAVTRHGASARRGDARRALDGEPDGARDPRRIFVADVSALRRFPSRDAAENQGGLRRQGRGALRPPRFSARAAGDGRGHGRPLPSGRPLFRFREHPVQRSGDLGAQSQPDRGPQGAGAARRPPARRLRRLPRRSGLAQGHPGRRRRGAEAGRHRLDTDISRQRAQDLGRRALRGVQVGPRRSGRTGALGTANGALLQFTKLRVTGFKSFVDQAELLIEPGLTGIVGPNGCGKSNLIEALRWVMGETSARQMRGGEMDDVIFAGSAERPGRNFAEVVVELDNGAGAAAPPWGNERELLVSRRIERARGSVYRLNGRELRARDVHLLLADAATGARSAALVTQGQVAQMIAAKPAERRALLEEAAGIVGLHARRHEAELRLQSAEANLRRVDDVLAM